MNVAVRIAGCLCAFAMTLGVSGRLVGDPAPAKPESASQVKIDNFTFTPNEVKIAVGTTVQWVNHDDIPHTVVSDDKTTFKSKALDTDDNFSYTFSKAGTYPYFCSIHPKMTGKVIVQ
jgi:plastocyanin